MAERMGLVVLVSAVLVALTAAALGTGSTWSAAVLVLTALILTPRDASRSLCSSLPAALVWLLVGTGALLMLAAVVGVELLHTPLALRACLALAAILLGAVAWARRPRHLVLTTRTELILAAPALLLVVLGLGMALRGIGAEASWLLLGGDAAYHLLFAAGVDSLGALSYNTSAYPRMLHAFVATLSAAADPTSPQETMLLIVSEFARVQWFAWALTVLTTSLLAHRLAQSAPPRLALAAGLLAGSLMLGAPFFGFVLAYGFFTTALLAHILVALTWEITQRRASSAGIVMFAGAAFALAAHTWQLALLPLGLIWAVAFLRWARARTYTLAVCLISTALAALSLPPLLAVAFRVGVAHAASGGEAAPLPRTFLLLGLAGSAALLIWTLRARRRGMASPACSALMLLALLTPLLLSLTALALAVRTGAPLEMYYLKKLLWNAAALGLAPLTAATALLLARLRLPEAVRRSTLLRLPLATLGGSVAVLGALLLVLTPLDAATGRWFTGGAVTRALATPGTSADTVPWSGTEGLYADQVTYALLGVHTLQGDLSDDTRRGNFPGENLCVFLAARSDTQVLSPLPPHALVSREGCTPDTLARTEWLMVGTPSR